MVKTPRASARGGNLSFPQGEGPCRAAAPFHPAGRCAVGLPLVATPSTSWPQASHPLQMPLGTLPSGSGAGRWRRRGFVVITAEKPLHHNLDGLCQALPVSAKAGPLPPASSPFRSHLETKRRGTLTRASSAWNSPSHPRPHRHHGRKRWAVARTQRWWCMSPPICGSREMSPAALQARSKQRGTSAGKPTVLLGSNPAGQREGPGAGTVDLRASTPQLALSLCRPISGWVR